MAESWTGMAERQRQEQILQKYFWESSVNEGLLGKEIEKGFDQAIDRILAAAPKSTFEAIPLVANLIEALIKFYLSASPETDNPSTIVVSRMCYIIKYSLQKRKMEDTEMFVYRAAVSIGDMVDNDDDFQRARWRPNRKPEYAVLVQDLPEDDFTLANAMEEFSWMTEDLPKKVDQETDRIIDADPKSAIEAIPAVVKLIQSMTKNDYPSTKEVKYCAYLIWESVLKKQIETRESRADWEWPTAEFIIQAANGIGSAANRSEKFEERSWERKPTSVDSTPTDIKPEIQPTAPSHAPPDPSVFHLDLEIGEIELMELIKKIVSVSDVDAIPKVMKLILKLCKTDKASPEQLTYFASQIAKIAQKLDGTFKPDDKETHDRINFVIQAATKIRDIASAKIKETAESQSEIGEIELMELIKKIVSVSDVDAIPKVMKLILKLCKTDKASPEQLIYFASQIAKIAQKLNDVIKPDDKETHDRINFVIQAATKIRDVAAKPEAKASKPTGVAVFHNSSRPSAVSSIGSKSTPPITPPPSTTSARTRGHGEFGGARSKKRSNHKTKRSHKSKITKY
jgi:hypothetical protein